MKKCIGYIQSTYPEIRCIINKCSDAWQYKRIGKTNDFLIKCRRVIPKVKNKLLHQSGKTNWNHRAIYRPVTTPKVDVIHTFNAVCDTDLPWVCTFETIVPRTNTTCNRGLPEPDAVTMRGFELLCDRNCLAAIALSEATKKIQLMAMDYLDIPNREEISQKIIIRHPPQRLLIRKEELDLKFANLSEQVNFIFVGRLFFRKGGAQVVDVFSQLVKQYPNMHLTVISKLQHGDAVSRTTANDREKYLSILQNSDWITYYEELPNAQVLELCKEAHIGLLPSFADTYGYSVLEMQACGCPVITTDIRAMTEINNEHCGYLIRVPQHPSTEAKYDTEEDLETLKEKVAQGLFEIIHTIMNDPDRVKKKAMACADRIVQYHSPEEYGKFLEDIYNRK